MKIRDGYIKCKTFDSWVVVAADGAKEKNNMMIRLNETASEIWDGIAAGKTAEDIADGFVSEYGITKEKALDSIKSLTDKLNEAGILE